MSTPLISVIVPVYNASAYLEKSLGSLCAQTYQNLEIIAVDDGSLDDSFRILEEMSAKDHRIRVFTKENGGSSSARNAGLKVSTGDYIGFIDADDYIEKDMYENLLNTLEQNYGADVAQIQSCEEDENGRMIKDFGEGFDKSDTFTGKEYFRTLLLHTGDSSFCTKLFRRSVFGNFSFSEGRLNEDFELLVKMSEKIRSLKVCQKPGYHIILRQQSNTRGAYKQSFYENVMENASSMLVLTAKKYPEYKREAVHFYLIQAMWFLLHIPSSEMREDNELYSSVMKNVKKLKKFIITDDDMPLKYKRNLCVFAFLPAKTVKRMHERLHAGK